MSKSCSNRGKEKWKFSSEQRSTSTPNVLPSPKKGSRGQTSAHPCYASRHYTQRDRSYKPSPPQLHSQTIHNPFLPSPSTFLPRMEGNCPLAPFSSIARNDVIYPAYLMKPRLKTFFKTRFKSFEVETRDFPPDYSSSFLFLLLSLSVSLRRRRYQQ